jgi:hypothetical protein
MTRDEKVKRLVERDIDSILNYDDDHSFLHSVLMGDGWVQYNNLTDQQVNDEYQSMLDNE